MDQQKNVGNRKPKSVLKSQSLNIYLGGLKNFMSAANSHLLKAAFLIIFELFLFIITPSVKARSGLKGNMSLILGHVLPSVHFPNSIISKNTTASLWVPNMFPTWNPSLTDETSQAPHCFIASSIESAQTNNVPQFHQF